MKSIILYSKLFWEALVTMPNLVAITATPSGKKKMMETSYFSEKIKHYKVFLLLSTYLLFIESTIHFMVLITKSYFKK